MRGRLTGKRSAVIVGGAVLAVVAGVVPAFAATYSQTPHANWTVSDGRVYTIARAGNTIILGGSFTQLRSANGSQTVTRNRLAALDATTGALLSWNPGANGEVRALAVSADGQSVFVGGAFSSIAGSSASRLAAISMSNGSRIGSFTAYTNGTVRGLSLNGSVLYLGGSFTTVNGSGHSHIGAISASGGANVSGFNASADAAVYSIKALGDGRVVVGGAFTTLGASTRYYIGAVDGSSGSTSSWNPAPPCSNLTSHCYVLGLAADATSVYAAVAGPGGRAISYNASSGSKRWTQYADGDVQAIDVYDGVVYAGGHFDPDFGGQTRSGIAAITASNGSLDNYAPLVRGALRVWAVLAGPDYLRLGGEFTLVNGSSRRGYAEFPVTSTPPPPPSSTTFSESWTGSNGSAWSANWARSTANGTADIQGNRGRLAYNDTSGAYARAQLTGPAAVSDTDVTLSYQWSSATARAYFSVFVRGTGGWGNSYRPRSGYGVQIQSDSRTVLVQRSSGNGAATTVASVSSAQVVTTARQWLRLRVAGSTIQLKIWADGSSEPGSWTWVGSDSQVTGSGQVFVSLVRAGSNSGAKNVLLDDLAIR